MRRLQVDEELAADLLELLAAELVVGRLVLASARLCLLLVLVVPDLFYEFSQVAQRQLLKTGELEIHRIKNLKLAPKQLLLNCAPNLLVLVIGEHLALRERMGPRSFAVKEFEERLYTSEMRRV